MTTTANSKPQPLSLPKSFDFTFASELPPTHEPSSTIKDSPVRTDTTESIFKDMQMENKRFERAGPDMPESKLWSSSMPSELRLVALESEAGPESKTILANHERELKEMKATHKSELKAIKAELNRELEMIKTEYELQLETVMADIESKLESIKADSERQSQTTKEQIASLEARVTKSAKAIEFPELTKTLIKVGIILICSILAGFLESILPPYIETSTKSYGLHVDAWTGTIAKTGLLATLICLETWYLRG